MPFQSARAACTNPSMAAAPPLGTHQFRPFVEANVDLARGIADPARRAGFARILTGTERLLTAGSESPLRRIPRLIGEAMAEHGWEWNGFYCLGSDDRLHVGPAFGPPVCAEVERKGGVFTSGMCFDCLAANQTLVAWDVTRWPGYVSCDPASGLTTKASIVCPIRDRSGAPFACWDLDSTAELEPGDVRFMDVFFATLCRTLDLERGDLEPA